MDWQCPNVTIGGLPIPEQEFTWALTAGPTPYMTQFWVPISDYEKFLALQNPVVMEWTLTGGVRGEPELLSVRFDNLWLLTPARIDEMQCLWRIADARYGWQGKKMTFSYNKTRIQNAIGKVVPPNEITPYKLREPYDTYAKGRYVEWSVKDDGKPYSIGEIIVAEFVKMGIPFVNTNDQDLSFILENIEAEGEDIYRALAYLLQMGRLNMGINVQGQAYIYSIFSYLYQNEDQMNHILTMHKTHPGTIYMQDKRKIRPESIDVVFEKKMETWFTAGPVAESLTADQYKIEPIVEIEPLAGVWTERDINERRVIGLINVIQVPLPVTIDGKQTNIGEWVPLHKFLAAYGMTELDVRQGMFSGLMELKLTMQLVTSLGIPDDQAERIAHHVCGAIKDSYRQIFMIEPYWMDRIKSWEPRRVAVIDNFSHYSPVSPLFNDYCVIPFLRNPKQAKGTVARWGSEVYNWLVNTEDPLRQKNTLGTIHVVNQPLGIFRSSYPAPKDQTTCTVIPFALDPLPLGAVGAVAPLLSGCWPMTTYNFQTILSVVWNVDINDNFRHDGRRYSPESKYWTIPVRYGNEGVQEFNRIEYFSHADFARFAVTSTQSTGEQQVTPYFAVNNTFLEALANSEAAKIMITLKDFYAGVITGAGYVPIKPVGNINSVVYSLSPANGLETIVDMRDSLPVPSIEHGLKQEYINYLRRQVSRADNANEALGGA